MLAILLLGMTGCASQNGSCEGDIEVPCAWQSPVNQAMTPEDPSCFLWWEALDDPILTSLILESADRNRDVLLAGLGPKNTLLKTINDVSAEIARNYVEFRGLQMRLKILNENIESQDEILTLNKSLSNRGFFDQMKENEDQASLESLLMQRSLIDFSMDKIIFHLSTLLSWPSEILKEILCEPQDLPDLIGCMPVGCPSDLICNDPSVKEARKLYESSGAKQALYNYQKTVLDAIERAETALTAFNYERDKIHYLEKAKSLKNEAYQISKDLNSQGFKDGRDLLLAHQRSLVEEDLFIEGKVELLVGYINLYHALSSAWEACSDCP